MCLPEIDLAVSARSLDHLYAAFPLLPAAVIKKTYLSSDCSSFFAPAYQLLNKRLEAGEYNDQKLKKGRKPPKKTMQLVAKVTAGADGKEHHAVEEVEAELPEELKQEMDWLKARLRASPLLSAFVEELFADTVCSPRTPRAPAC